MIFFLQFNHFTKQASIPDIYFRNHVTLTGKVVKIHSDGCLSVLHLPLLWRARVNYISNSGNAHLRPLMIHPFQQEFNPF